MAKEMVTKQSLVYLHSELQKINFQLCSGQLVHCMYIVSLSLWVIEAGWIVSGTGPSACSQLGGGNCLARYALTRMPTCVYSGPNGYSAVGYCTYPSSYCSCHIIRIYDSVKLFYSARL